MKITSTRRLFLQGTAITGVAAAVAGCSQKGSEEQAKEQKEKNEKLAKEQTSLPSTAWERADYDKVKDGGTLNLSIDQLPANWNPDHIDGNEVSRRRVTVACGYDAHIKAGEDGKMEPNPDYIESAELTSEDPQIVTVKWNPKVKWDNGQPVKPEDLIAQQKALSGKDEAYSVTTTQGWELIKEIRKKDEHTLEIEYTQKFPDWLSFTFPYAPAEVYKDAKTFNTAYVTEPTPNCGPFKITNIDKSGGVVTLERNPDWWGQAPKLEKIIHKVTTQQNAPSSFANGELDALDIGDGDTYGQAKGRSDASLQKSNGLTWTHLTINTKGGKGVLGDAKVREAIFKAVNRTAVSQAVVGPLEAPVILKDNYIYMPGQDGYEDSFGGELAEPDPEAAKKVLEDAGYKMNGKVYEKDGKKLELSIIIPAETKSNEDRAKQVMTDLNNVGFKVSLKTVPSDKYFTDYILKGSFDLVTFSWEGTLLAELSSANTYLPDSEQNYTAHKDEEITKLNNKVQSEMDPAARKKAANEFSKKVGESFTVLPFYATPKIVGAKKGLVNYGAAQFETVDWTTVGFTE